jgi:hypothetical protein
MLMCIIFFSFICGQLLPLDLALQHGLKEKSALLPRVNILQWLCRSVSGGEECEKALLSQVSEWDTPMQWIKKHSWKGSYYIVTSLFHGRNSDPHSQYRFLSLNSIQNWKVCVTLPIRDHPKDRNGHLVEHSRKEFRQLFPSISVWYCPSVAAL